MTFDFPRLDSADLIAIDVETYDPDLMTKGMGAVRNGYIAGIAVATRDKAWYLPIRHEGGGNLDPAKVREWVNRELSTPIPKTGANLQYDLAFLWSEGFQVAGPFLDIQIAEPLIDENRYSFSLETLAQEYLGVGKEEDAMCEYIRAHYKAKPGKEKSYIWKCPAHVVAPYAKQDVRLPILILDKQLEEIKRQELSDIWQVETDLLPILVKMHLHGVRVDVPYAEELKIEWAAKLIELEAGFRGINPGSGQQIAAALDALGVKYPRHPPTAVMKAKGQMLGNPKLGADVLKELEGQAPFLTAIRESKQYSHFLNTFLQGYIIDSHIAGRVHATFNQLKSDESGTVTGRTSTKNPNLANIPNPEKSPYFSQKCRGMFLPEQGQEWLRFDLSQMEYRLIVHYASTLPGKLAQPAVDAYTNDPATDFHTMCAELTGLSRKNAKCIAEGSLVLTDVGLVPIEKVTRKHKVWDGVEMVSHAGVIDQGLQQVVSYMGLAATPDHKVYLAWGDIVPLEQAKREQLPLRKEGFFPPTKALSGGFVRVFDIQNCGPRFRFTVSGILVCNCINFGIAFGMGKNKLAASLGLSVSEGLEILEKYHEKVPFVKAIGEAASQRAGNRGYIRTVGGRLRHFSFWEQAKWSDEPEPPMRDKNAAIEKWGPVRRAGTHKALNSLTQGSNADWIKKAMVMGVKDGVTDVLGMYLNTVYDELGFSILTGDPQHEEAAKHMKWIMENAYQLRVPVLVSEGRGNSWGTAG